MTHFVTTQKHSALPAEKIYSILADFKQLEALLPQGKISNWQTDGDTCRFKADGVGELGLSISKKEPFSLVQYTGHGKVPFDFHLRIHMSPTDEGTDLSLSADARLNPMLKMMVAKPIQKFLEMLNNAISDYKQE